MVGENGGAKRNVYVGLIWVYMWGLLRLRKFADQFISACIGFTWFADGVE